MFGCYLSAVIEVKIMQTPYKRVMSALRGEKPDKTPFTVYSEMLPQCLLERDLRNRGLCIVKRTISYKRYTPNVKEIACHYTDETGRSLIKTVYSTPYGDLSTLVEPAGFTSWVHERMFKTPEDYKALLFMFKDTVVEPDYDAAAQTVAELGEDFVVRDNMSLEPMQSLISSTYIGMETWCMEWMERQDEILKLYEARVEISRKIYPLVANGPLEFANYGGNVVPQIIGPKVFREYYMPHYAEAAEILHKKSKLIGCHFDADNTTIMDAIAETDLDYIEAYDPGMSPSVSEARKAWPDKVLWLNWPSAWHLRPVEEVKSATIGLIEEAAPGNGFIIGITEDVPEERWRGNFTAIMDGIDEEAE
ncbi:MAG: hypothetical protein PHT33_02605 [bacterium]|nr:hypothetical protein [bacterium]